MKKPEIKHELEVKHGTIYGLEEAETLMDVLQNNAPSCGERVMEFERAFADFCGSEYALTTTSATTALTLTGIAAGVSPGDEVITTPLSWIATASAFSALGAKIRFCDVDPRTLNMDPDKLEALITDKTKAVVPIHLFGQCAPMDEINRIASRHNLVVIDDCAHAPGSSYKGRSVGTLADMSVFSFQQQKNMSTLGEGGMVTTNSKAFHDAVLSYRSLCARVYGGSNKYLAIDEDAKPMNKQYWHLEFDDIGHNYRMIDAQAAVGLVQLKRLPEQNARRQEIAHMLDDRLADVRGLETPYVDPDGEHVYHVYMIQLDDEFPLSKTDFMWELYTTYGIKAWSHYIPIHLTKPYVERGHAEGECPVAEEAVKRHVTLPVHPRLTNEAVEYVSEVIHKLAST